MSNKKHKNLMKNQSKSLEYAFSLKYLLNFNAFVNFCELMEHFIVYINVLDSLLLNVKIGSSKMSNSVI